MHLIVTFCIHSIKKCSYYDNKFNVEQEAQWTCIARLWKKMFADLIKIQF